MSIGTALEREQCEQRIARAAQSIHAQFPELRELDVRLFASGLDHEVFLVGEVAVFRFPRRVDIAQQLTRELAVLQLLAPLLPLAVPNYRWIGQPDVHSPHSFAGYPLLAGEIGLGVKPVGDDAERIGSVLGHFIRALQQASAELGSAADGVPLENSLEPWCEGARSDLERISAELDPAAAHWCEEAIAKPPSAHIPVPTLLHGDLAAEHVLLDGALHPIGVIDWSDAARGDPARDLAGLVHWGGVAMASAAQAAWNAADPTLLERAAWYAACRALADIAYGHECGDLRYVLAGQRALELARGTAECAQL